MRITIVHGAFFPAPAIRGGAVQKVWHALAEEFVRRGHGVTEISRRHPELPDEERSGQHQHLRVRGFDTPRSLIQLKWRDFIYSRRAQRVLPPAEILVTNTFWLPILQRSEQCGRLCVHVARYPRGQMRFYRHAARLQTVSQPIARALALEIPEATHKIRAIANPVLLPALVRAPIEHAGAAGKMLLYVGRIHPEKGIDLLLKAFLAARAPAWFGWRLRLVGPWQTELGGGGERYYSALRRRTNEWSRYVEWNGPEFAPAKLAVHYAAALLFVYPSLAERGETFGLAPLEAMAHGCPALVSALDCFQDFIRDQQNGFVFDHRAADPVRVLAGKLDSLLSDPACLQSVGGNARVTAAGFSLAAIADQYLADFRSLLPA